MNWLAQAVGAMSHESAERQGIMTLGELRSALRALPGETRVLLNGDPPASLASYRGMYERLAIGVRRPRRDEGTALHKFAAYDGYTPGACEVTIAEPVTAAEMIAALDLADGEEFEGYKGGQYEMHAGTYMHAAENGDCGLAVYGVRLGSSGVAEIEVGEYEW